jgi:dipeptidyl-peptidase-4
VLAAAAAGAPVTDWRNYDTIYTERYLGLPQENEEGYRESSPVHFAENLKIPLLLLHNFEDDNVLFQQTMQMSVALQNAGKHFETVLYPQRTHGVTGKLKQHLYEEVTAFFEKHLIAVH